MTAAARSGRGPSSVPGILSPRKITVKGAPSGRVCDGAQTAPPLSVIFHGKTLGIYRMDGPKRRVPFSASVEIRPNRAGTPTSARRDLDSYQEDGRRIEGGA